MNPPTASRRAWLAGAILAAALLLLGTGCATNDAAVSSTGPGSAESSTTADEPGTAYDDQSDPGPTDEPGTAPDDESDPQPADEPGTAPDDESDPQPADEPGTDSDGPGQAEGDYVMVDGEQLPVMFSGYTVDDSKVAARTVASYCDSNHMRTGQFRAWGYLVDDAGQVLTTDINWIGLVRLTLNTRDDVELAPYVDVELNDRGLWLNLVDPNPADPDGGFSVDGKTATGDFLVPDMNGGPNQRVEFRVTCPD